MKKLIILLLAAIACMNPMCSGATLQCEDEEIYNEYVESGSFVYRFETELSGNDYIKIKIITDGVETEKIIRPKHTKKVIVDGKEMWETSPVFITDRSQVLVYWANCDWLY